MGGLDIMSKRFGLLPKQEQIFIILASQDFLWNTMRENIQKKVVETWEYELNECEVISYVPKNKRVVQIEKGRNFHQILIGLDVSTVHKDLPCGCEYLYNEIINQFLLVEPHNECQEHKRTFRKRVL